MLGEKVSADTVTQLRKMDQPANMPALFDLARKAASVQVRQKDLVSARPS
jgi:hypothetical protein